MKIRDKKRTLKASSEAGVVWKPYYDEDGITIYNCDCRNILEQLGENEIDLILTDPPYGLKWAGTGFKKIKYTDWQMASEWDIKPDKNTIKLLMTVGKEWIIWGGNYLASVLGDSKAPLVWDKKTGDNTFADGEIAFTSFKSGTLRIFRHQWCGAFKNSERNAISQHPTQKPIQLMEWCIIQADKRYKNNLILDPFMGSGTTLKAAKELGRRAIGIEISERYCEIAVRRLQQMELQLN